MKLDELSARIKETWVWCVRHFRFLKPDVKRLAFMLFLFIILSIAILVYDISYCVHCQSGRCVCTPTTITTLPMLMDFVAAIALSYILVMLVFFTMGKVRSRVLLR